VYAEMKEVDACDGVHDSLMNVVVNDCPYDACKKMLVTPQRPPKQSQIL
jgi:hypothetical protein